MKKANDEKSNDVHIIKEAKFLQENFKTGLLEFLNVVDYFWFMARIEAITANLYQLSFAALKVEPNTFHEFKTEITVGLFNFMEFNEKFLNVEIKKKEMH